LRYIAPASSRLDPPVQSLRKDTEIKRLRSSLTYANVISTLCLILLLGGGTAYAASQLGKESVGARQLKKGAVTPAKLSKASQAELRGPAGSQGPAGIQGPKGEPGAKGEPGSKGEAGEGATKLFAQIKEDGTVNTSSVPVKVDHYGNGVYLVDFGRDISHCVAVANEGSIPVFSEEGASTPAAQGYGVRTGLTSAGEEFPPGYLPNETVDIETFSGSSLENTSFSVAVLC
jgi:hypothetical protein